MISRVPTVDELVEAAINDAGSFEMSAPPSEKIAATKASEPEHDMFEKTAEELESWADEAEEIQAEVEKVASADKAFERHDAIMKLAMASTVLHTLHDLDEHGQLGRLVEKIASSDKPTGRDRILQLLGQ